MENKNIKWLLALLFAGTLMGALDLAIIGPALPVIQAEFDMEPRALAWLLNAYVLLQMIGALLLAKLADRHGPKPIYIASIALFALGSLLIVIADSPWTLYLGRGVQGFGAGGFFPASAAVIGARLSPEKRGQALGVLGMVWGLAFLVGPILGGIFLRLSWHWLFAINLPIAALLIIGTIKLMPGGGGGEPKPFDKKGMALMVATLGALIITISGVDTSDAIGSLLSVQVSGGFALIVLLSIIFWRVEKSAIDPIVRPALLQSRQIAKSCIISAGSSALQSGNIFLPALLVLSLKMSAADASLLLLPGVVAATVMAPIFGRMINRVGTRSILIGGQALVGIALAVYAFVDLNIPIYLAASIIGGIGSAGLVGAPLRYIVLAETGNHDRAAAQGLLSVVSSVGRLLGAAMVGAVAASYGGGIIGYQSAFFGLISLAIVVLFTAMTLKSKAEEQAAAAQAWGTKKS